MWFKNAQCIHCWSHFFDLHLASGSASNRFSRHSQNSSWSKAVNFKTAVHRSPLKSSMLRCLQKISSCRYFWKAFGSSKWFLGTWYSSRTCDHYLSGQRSNCQSLPNFEFLKIESANSQHNAISVWNNPIQFNSSVSANGKFSSTEQLHRSVKITLLGFANGAGVGARTCHNSFYNCEWKTILSGPPKALCRDLQEWSETCGNKQVWSQQCSSHRQLQDFYLTHCLIAWQPSKPNSETDILMLLWIKSKLREDSSTFVRACTTPYRGGEPNT